MSSMKVALLILLTNPVSPAITYAKRPHEKSVAQTGKQRPIARALVRVVTLGHKGRSVNLSARGLGQVRVNRRGLTQIKIEPVDGNSNQSELAAIAHFSL